MTAFSRNSEKKFSDLSIQLTKSLSKKEKKDNGIFFTPSTITSIMLSKLFSHLDVSNKFYSITEPSCGSGEFVYPLLDLPFLSQITCIEKHPTIFTQTKTLFSKPLAINHQGKLESDKECTHYPEVSTTTTASGPSTSLPAAHSAQHSLRLAVGHQGNEPMKQTEFPGNQRLCCALWPSNPPGRSIRWIHEDFLKTCETSDIFIGNPPFFVIPQSSVPSKYMKYMEGRPNIFVLFILHALHLLNENGFLAFVIPSSFLNSKYYEKTRRFIYEKFTIQEMIPFSTSDFIETKQNTIGIILQKRQTLSENERFCIKYDEQVMFFDPVTKSKLDELINGCTSLEKLGLKVKTGPFVWNQHKSILTDDHRSPLANAPASVRTSSITNQSVAWQHQLRDNKILVYNSNITKNKFEIKEFKNKEKKQYVDTSDFDQGPMIVVNRGNGNSKYKFTYCYLPDHLHDKKYLIENHLNMIVGPEEKLKMVMKSFEDKRTKQFLDLYCGNNGLSKSELQSILPIYQEYL
jgi:adenine-specific DNA-methyltransferase